MEILSRACRRLALVVAHAALVLAAVPARVLAQGGWVTEKHPELGLTFPRARNYEQIPTPPDEVHVVLHYAEKGSENPKEKKSIRPELEIVWVEKVPEARNGEEAGLESSPKRPRPVDGLASWIERTHPKWTLGAAVEGKTRNGRVGAECSLTPPSEPRDSRVGWLYTYQDDQRTIAFFGVCDEKDLRDQVRIWRYSAERVEFAEPEATSDDSWTRMYARLALPNPEYRIAVRKKLVSGWKAVDTEHYIVIHDTADQPLVRKVVRDLELLNAEYRKLFPPAAPIEAVSTVRLCKDREEYLSFGGAELTSGFWNATSEELVLYDAERVENHVRIDADTFGTLYHEAFHQYIHYACGELPPHPWFNEGHGEYFGGARIKDSKVRSIDVVPESARVIARAVDQGRHVPWKEMIRYEQGQYCAPDMVELCYAQGWSMIFFLRRSPEVEKHPEWARILPTYFQTLRDAHRAALAALPESGKGADRLALAKAGLEARQQALDAAFDGVDLAGIEKAWIEFVRGLEVPHDR